LVALRHAHAFIKALMNESDGIERDLQIIFPLLLGGLWEAEEPIRREVAVCVRLIAGAKHDGKAPEIYGLKVLPPGVTGTTFCLINLRVTEETCRENQILRLARFFKLCKCPSDNVGYARSGL
jgi:hypothetical protein